MLSCVRSASLSGSQVRPVLVETHVSNGLPGFTVVGLPDAACRESRDRVRAALMSSGLKWPLKRVTVNLAPSGVRKVGAGLDLAIAVGLLAAVGELSQEQVGDFAFVGELGLDGSLRPVRAAISLAAAAGKQAVVLPVASAGEVSALPGVALHCAPTLSAVVAALRGERDWASVPPAVGKEGNEAESVPDLAQVKGQPLARRALEIAAAGGHHLLLVGPSGSGKTMLGSCLASLMPDLGPEQSIEVAKLHSLTGGDPPSTSPSRPPLRAPHHRMPLVSLVGGGSSGTRPGEVSLAHNGVLFLDELAEFPPAALDALRQPLEDGSVTIARAGERVRFPARFTLVATASPCPCGEGGTPGSCRCSAMSRSRYDNRLSGPLADRFDMRVSLERPRAEDLLESASGEPTATVKARVGRARSIAVARGGCPNGLMTPEALGRLAPITSAAALLAERRVRGGRLSARGLHRAWRVARTVADLDGAPVEIDELHMAEALALDGSSKALRGSAQW
ncbi:MAG: YifB family Mg chelatase-like AAA ATPase [Actinomycetota bacterium]|nr:YifB family Mg chelatase-like AAA ATPase [Actinomycetota bacterium]